MKTVKFKNFTATLSEDGNYVEGYASTFGNIDHAGEIVERGAFTKTLKNRTQPVRFLWQHLTHEPIGVIEDMGVDSKGLWFRARFDDTDLGQRARKCLLSGSVDSFSIGYRVINWLNDDVKGRPVVRLTEIALMEISVVTFPCNEDAKATAVKAAVQAAAAPALPPEMMQLLTDFAQFLMDRGTAGAEQGETAPETPAEGDPAPDSAEDTPEAEEAPADAPEGETGEEAPADGEDEAEKAPEDAENDPVESEDDADEGEGDEEEDEKALRDIALSFKLAEIAALLRA